MMLNRIPDYVVCVLTIYTYYETENLNMLVDFSNFTNTDYVSLIYIDV